MENVTQIFFKEQISVPGESRSPRLQKQKEVFKEFVQKECEQVSEEEQGITRDIQKDLSNDLARILESLGLSSEEKADLLAGIMEQINELVSSGQEAEVIPFLQGMGQAETADKVKTCLEEFFALDTKLEWGAEIKALNEEKAVKLGSQGGAIETAETFAAEISSSGSKEDKTGVAPQETLLNQKPALPSEDQAFKFTAQEKTHQGMEKAIQFLSRKAQAETSQSGFNSEIENLAETVSYFKQSETGPLNLPSVQEQMAPEQMMETKLSLLQDIRQLVEKAEFRQGVQEWQARLELKPEQLGNTVMRLEMSQEKAMLDIVVTRPEAQEMVQNSLQDLEQIFADKGISIDNINVEVDPGMQFSENSFSQTGSDRQFSSAAGFSGNDPEFEYWEGQEIYSPDHLFVESEGVNCFA